MLKCFTKHAACIVWNLITCIISTIDSANNSLGHRKYVWTWKRLVNRNKNRWENDISNNHHVILCFFTAKRRTVWGILRLILQIVNFFLQYRHMRATSATFTKWVDWNVHYDEIKCMVFVLNPIPFRYGMFTCKSLKVSV